MKKLIFFVFSLIIISQVSYGQKPTKADITTAMNKTWEKQAVPKQTVKINDIKLGTSEKSNYAQQLEGVPKNALVTHAKIDWDLNVFYTNTTRVTRRITTAWVYKDQFNEWAIMNIGTVYPK